MSNAKTETGRSAASGRTPQEHAEIARALETDPKGERSVTLPIETALNGAVGLLTAVEVAFIFLPMLFHAVLGVQISACRHGSKTAA